MRGEFVYDKMTNAEFKVSEFLDELAIKWTFEHPIFVWDENNRPRVWTPDFYLSQFGIYVEVCGSDRFDYEYRRRIFENNRYKVIFLHLYKEDNRWKNHLYDYLNLFISKMAYDYKKLLKTSI